MSSSSGQVYLAFSGALDYETTQSHTFQYQVSDSGDPQLSSAIRNLTISINDINDNRPIIRTTNEQVNIRENTPIGTLIFTIVATDADSGINSQLRYQLTQIIPPSSLFSIDGISGEITLSQQLDYEANLAHWLTIRVYDMGSPRLNAYTNLTVIVVDRNDNTPVFSPPSYAPSILENPTADFAVVQVTATDSDSGEHMNLEFSLVDDTNDPGLFNVTKTSHTTAVVSVANSARVLDRERQGVYLLYVVATDNRNVSTGGVPDRDPVVNTISAEVSLYKVNNNNNINKVVSNKRRIQLTGITVI